MQSSRYHPEGKGNCSTCTTLTANLQIFTNLSTRRSIGRLSWVLLVGSLWDYLTVIDETLINYSIIYITCLNVAVPRLITCGFTFLCDRNVH